MSEKYNISVQGTDKNLKVSNGSFDSVEFLNLSRKEAEHILLLLKEIKAELDYSKNDLCPLSFSITLENYELHSFIVENHKFFYEERTQDFSLDEIFEVASGELKFNNKELRKESMANLGMLPLRKRHILPSNKDLKAEDIQYIEKMPQITLPVWRSRSWLEAALTAPFCIGSFFVLVGFLVLKNPQDAAMAPYMFLIAVICFLLYFPLFMLSKTKISCGVDWDTNALWIKRGKKITGFAPDANYIEDIAIMKNDSIKQNPLWLSNPEMPMVFRKREWHLVFKKNGNDNFWTFYGSRFATKKEATNVAVKMMELLKSQE